MIQVILVDDHELIRRGIRMTLEDCEDINVVGEAGDWTELRELLKTASCDVLLLDINLPGKNGIEILKSVRDAYPQIRTLMLSMFPEDQYGVRSLRAGALGYLTKASAPDQLVNAVRQVATGKKFLTPEIAAALADNLGIDDDHRHNKLSDREFQTLKLITEGKRLSDIAQIMSLSPKTVSVYRARLLEKLGVGSNAEAARYAVEHGLVEKNI